MIQREAGGLWTAWTVGLSGSKQDCLGWFRSKRAALAELRKTTI